MPRRADLNSVLVIGSGPIVIGQGCEFDYSGTQACRVLRQEGLRVSLVNSNPATIMTDPEFADATYVEPITLDVLEKVIAKERPDAILPTLGGQTALNAAVELHDAGILARYQVELIGADIETIRAGEDRKRFKELVIGLGAAVPDSRICHDLGECEQAAAELGYPVVVRPSFTLGGSGSGIARGHQDLRRMAGAGLDASPVSEVLLEESIIGWKEFELELMRDRADNVVVVCSIENIDPMGVHTGDSVTVAPAMTLTDREYQQMRDTAIDVLRAVGVDTGGCNIQFAVHPQTGRLVVIEMNPRVSRSSALASKATGFPIAKIAARLAIGYTLDEIRNDITGETPASFEPALDYVVVKVPRFAFEKFPGADPVLTTHMKSVGEAMAIGRSFAEALQKALRSLEQPGAPFSWQRPPGARADLLARSAVPHDGRLTTVHQALRAGASVAELVAATGIDAWFIDQIKGIEEQAERMTRGRSPGLTAAHLRAAKAAGFADGQIAQIRGTTEAAIRRLRHDLGIRPVYHMVDTCAAEFAASTPYLYSTYDEETEVPAGDRPKVIILGSGPNRIGQGIEFDYACVHASFALTEAGYETVMVNCNPETVSTDYDTSGRLYFEPLTLEDVLEVVHAEQASGTVAGVIVQLGGQTPLGLARALAAAGRAARRHLGRRHPPGRGPGRVRRGTGGGRASCAPARHRQVAPGGEGRRRGDRLSRPGAALVRARRPRHGDRLRRRHAGSVRAAGRPGQPRASGADRPVPRRRHRDRRRRAVRRRGAVPRRRDGAHRGGRHPLRRLGVRAAADHARPRVHRHDPRVHRGDCPRRRRPRPAERAVRAGGRGAVRAGGEPARVADGALRVEGDRGAAGQGGGQDHARRHRGRAAGRGHAARGGRRRHAAAGRADRGQGGGAPVRPVPGRRGQGVDTVLGPEMRSTGEVMGIDEVFGTAYAKSQAAAYGSLPVKGRAFVSVASKDKRSMVFPVKRLADLGFEIWATRGTAEILRRNGVHATIVRKHGDGRGPDGEPTIVERIMAGQVDLIVNTPFGSPGQSGPRLDGYEIRTAAVRRGIPCVTTVQGLAAAVQGIEAITRGEVGVRSLQEHAARLRGPAGAGRDGG